MQKKLSEDTNLWLRNLTNDLKDKETVTNLLLVLTEPGNEFFRTKVGKEFVAGLEKKVGEVYLSKKSDKPVLLFAIAVIFLVAGISFRVAGKYIADDAYKQKMAEFFAIFCLCL